MIYDQIYKAWHAVGADAAGLVWEDFVKALAAPVQGWKLVPVDPTIQMCLAGAKAADSNDGAAEKAYYAMLGAAPQPAPVQQGPVAWTWELQDNGSKYFGESWDKAEQPAQQQEPVSFLANGTRFKMSFFDCAAPEGDEHGESDVGTYVTCFEAFAKELDGRWVALVAADDDCHLKLTSPQPAQQQQEPVAWMEMVVANLVREGVNKHKARELAQHFYTSPQPAQQEPVATKLETQQFGCFHVSAEDFQRLKNLPVGTKLYTRPQTREPEQCIWTQVDDEHMPDTWQADCGAMWTFTDGGPKDNDMHYCPKCGKPTVEAAHQIGVEK